jgi:hypothetical protein
VVAGFVTDLRGDKQLPFMLAIGVLMVGALSSFLMHPEKQFTKNCPPAPRQSGAGGVGSDTPLGGGWIPVSLWAGRIHLRTAEEKRPMPR